MASQTQQPGGIGQQQAFNLQAGGHCPLTGAAAVERAPREGGQARGADEARASEAGQERDAREERMGS